MNKTCISQCFRPGKIPFLNGKVRVLKQWKSLKRNDHRVYVLGWSLVTGLEYFRLRPAGESQSTYGVLVTTMTKFYQFQGSLNNRMMADREQQSC